MFHILWCLILALDGLELESSNKSALPAESSNPTNPFTGSGLPAESSNPTNPFTGSGLPAKFPKSSLFDYTMNLGKEAEAYKTKSSTESEYLKDWLKYAESPRLWNAPDLLRVSLRESALMKISRDVYRSNQHLSDSPLTGLRKKEAVLKKKLGPKYRELSGFSGEFVDDYVGFKRDKTKSESEWHLNQYLDEPDLSLDQKIAVSEKIKDVLSSNPNLRPTESDSFLHSLTKAEALRAKVGPRYLEMFVKGGFIDNFVGDSDLHLEELYKTKSSTESKSLANSVGKAEADRARRKTKSSTKSEYMANSVGKAEADKARRKTKSSTGSESMANSVGKAEADKARRKTKSSTESESMANSVGKAEAFKAKLGTKRNLDMLHKGSQVNPGDLISADQYQPFAPPQPFGTQYENVAPTSVQGTSYLNPGYPWPTIPYWNPSAPSQPFGTQYEHVAPTSVQGTSYLNPGYPWPNNPYWNPSAPSQPFGTPYEHVAPTSDQETFSFKQLNEQLEVLKWQ